MPRLCRQRSMDPELAHAAPQCTWAQPEHMGRASVPLDAATRGREHATDVVTLDVHERARALRREGRYFLEFGRGSRQSWQLQRAVPRQDDRLLQHVLELADVPRPVV